MLSPEGTAWSKSTEDSTTKKNSETSESINHKNKGIAFCGFMTDLLLILAYAHFLLLRVQFSHVVNACSNPCR